MHLSEVKITEIFYLVDVFCVEFNKNISAYQIGKEAPKKPKMSQSEIITIMILFHSGAFKNTQAFRSFL